MGPLNEGKKSIGDTILGRDVFSPYKTDLEEHRGSVAGKSVTVIDTPGWGREHRASQSPGTLKEKLLESVFPPGVHALLLVIRTDKPFTEANRVSLQEHMELLGEKVWDHTVVLFTAVEWCKDVPIEHFICSEGSALRWIVERAKWKYYCLNISDRADTSKVQRLLGLIDKMVDGLQGCFELDKGIYEREVQRAKAREEDIKKMQEMQNRSWGSEPDPSPKRGNNRNNPPQSEFYTSYNTALSYSLNLKV